MSKNSFKVKKGLTLTPVDPSTIVDPEVGDLIVDSTDNDKFKKYDGSAFAEVTGSGGGVNYIENSGFESDISGWTGDTNLVISRITSGQLRGDASLQIAKAAADASTQQVYVDFTIDSADLAKKLTISFDYDASDANYSDADMKVLIIKDPLGTPVTIRPNGEDLMAGTGTHYAQFQTDATELDYRLVIEQDSTQALAVNVLIDNVQVGPTQIALGMPNASQYEHGTDFTVSITGGSVANFVAVPYKTYDGVWRMKFNGEITGFGTATTLTITMSGITTPANRQACSIAYSNSNGNFMNLWANSSASTFTAYSETAVNWATFVSYVSGDIELTEKPTWARDIQQAQMSEDFGGRDIRARYHSSSTSFTSSINKIIDFTLKTVGYDTANAVTTGTSWKFTAPETGYYRVETGVRFADSSAWLVGERAALYLYKNNAQVAQLDWWENPSSDNTLTYVALSGSDTIYLEKDDYIDIRGVQTSGSTIALDGGATSTYVAINKESSPQTILETETVAARYTSNSGQTVAATNNIIYEDLVSDTHNAYNTSTGVYTVPISGYYMITASAGTSAANTLAFDIVVDGTQILQIYGNVSDIGPRNGSVIEYIEKGQEVNIINTSGSNRTLSVDPRRNVFSIARIK